MKFCPFLKKISQKWTTFRVKAMYEQLTVAEKLSCFEIAAFFPSHTQGVKKAVISKQESFQLP